MESVNPKPPAFLGFVNVAQAIGAFFERSELPVHKNFLHSPLISCSTLFRRIKTLLQQEEMDCSTSLISIHLSAQDKSFEVQDLILSVTLRMRGRHSEAVSFFELRGIPRYLTGRIPSENLRT
eukprot:TRINITY_DN9495_c0_g1_i2.p2 TRINITY_DN9495_c0_g1~~TRINITY_DN9495_c0_g1_i2.p2  ORF type:complete len:123 (-),score=6.22 TRINITY_DN9495_c0_g1_i2:598-966(-)